MFPTSDAWDVVGSVDSETSCNVKDLELPMRQLTQRPCFFLALVKAS